MASLVISVSASLELVELHGVERLNQGLHFLHFY